MKKILFLSALVLTLFLASCSKSDNHNNTLNTPDIEARATELGYGSVAEYQEAVAIECSKGKHENCDILENGTHRACGYSDHSGTYHSGEHHNGLDHNHNGHNNDGKHHGGHGSGKDSGTHHR